LRQQFIVNVFIILVGSGGNLKRILQKLHKKNLVPDRGQLEKKYYVTVQAESLEGKKYYNVFIMQ
jgi:hypothetical protein